MSREREVHVAEDGLYLVEIEVLELVRRGEHDVLAAEAVRAVEEIARVELEQAPKKLRFDGEVPERRLSDLDAEHHRIARPHERRGTALARGLEAHRAVRPRLEMASNGREIRLEILHRARHGA